MEDSDNGDIDLHNITYFRIFVQVFYCLFSHKAGSTTIYYYMRKQSKPNRKKEMLMESLQLPKDVCMGALKVTMTGNSEAWIENYKGILEYTGQMILLQAKTCQVCFEGTRLSIDYYTNEDMKISGCISSVRYL